MITTIHIRGTATVHTTRAVATALTSVPGITKLDIHSGVAVVEHDGRATEDALRAAIAAAGYEVERVDIDPRRLPTR